MCTSNGHRLIIFDDDFCQTLSDAPSQENRETVKLFVASWVSLLTDSPLNPQDKPYRLYLRFLDRLRRDGLKATVLRFSGLAHELVQSHSLMGSSTSIGEWNDAFKDTPVFFEYNRYFKTGDVKLLDFLYTFLNFGKKLEYVDESFNSTAFSGWLDVENRLSDLKFDSVDVASLRLILSQLLPRFTWDDVRPKFGPGSVQERGVRGRIGKLQSFTYDPLIDRFLMRGHIGMYGLGEDHGLAPHKIIPDPERWSPVSGVSSRTARLRFVPKNLKVARSICMEPNTLMYFQQACLDRIVRLIGQSPFKRFIRLGDQSRNRLLALAGSFTGELDTIDLSSASDSVSYDLVKLIFPDSWRIMMAVTRSNSVITPDGSVKSIKKYAPMGSALCFPTQCLIFASVCIYAACLHTYDVEAASGEFSDWLPLNLKRVLSLFRDDVRFRRKGYQPLAVYGDDICVDGSLTLTVKSILSRLGFTVNDDKSFCGSQSFRESCGGYYLDGHDITPLYFRVKGVREKLTPSHVASQVQLINRTWDAGYRNLYRFLHRTLMTWECGRSLRNPDSAKNSIPYVSDPRHFGIRVTDPRNNHLRGRVNPDYQREEVRAWTISYEYRDDPGDLLPDVDAYEYMRWWASRRVEHLSEVYSSVPRYDSGGSGLRWRWIPVQSN